jgi:hypothetical protein
MIVQGYCPMGCGQTLKLGDYCNIYCDHDQCPDPDALDKIINDPETEHIVTFDDHYTVVHPLRERLTGLPNCELLTYLAGPWRPAALGTYRAVPDTLAMDDARVKRWKFIREE